VGMPYRSLSLLVLCDGRGDSGRYECLVASVEVHEVQKYTGRTMHHVMADFQPKF
jgi:hypothetical protein